MTNLSKVKFKKLHNDFKLPRQETEGAAGFDLRYCGDNPVTFNTPCQVEILDLGFAMELEPGYEAQIRPRSGLAARYGITVLNSPGTIDQDYTGPVKAILVRSGVSTGDSKSRKPLPPLTVNPGDRVCQMVINKVPDVQLFEVEELTQTERGDAGLGSTGVQ